jgi:uncharacterized protein HemX
MSKTMTALVAVLVALLAVAATGVGAYATGQARGCQTSRFR